MAMRRRTVSVAMCVTGCAGWAGGLTSYERMFAVFVILSCVSSQAQRSGRSAVADLLPGLAAIAAEDIDRQYIEEQTTSPRQERKR
jgi:hypothetical protein